MNTCPFCDFENPDDIHICLRCAALLNCNCPKCSAIIPPGNRYCGHCGTRLKEPAPPEAEGAANLPLETKRDSVQKEFHTKRTDWQRDEVAQASTELLGKRNEVTVVFANIANFTLASQSIDSEDLYLAVDEIMHLLSNSVYKFEGVIDKFTGDGLMALFGIPLNHENDPERAVRSALEMLHKFEEQRGNFTNRYHFDFQIHIGINSGSVIAGYLGNHQHLEYTVIGDTVNLASRLVAAAEAGYILVSFSTYQRTRPIFEYLSHPLLDLKGFTEPVPAFQPLSVRLESGEVRGLPGLQAPMIGRVQDLELLSQAFKQVISEKNSKLVLISGEAGIGKSRLIAEFRRNFITQPVNIIQGACEGYMRSQPYRVVADIIRNMIHVSESDPEKVQREALQEHLNELGLNQTDTLPYIMQILGQLSSDPVLEIRIKQLEPSMLQRQTHLALRMLLVAEARYNPTVVIIDDLHWVDPVSRQFIENLCQSLENVPILLVLVARDFEKYEDTHLISLAADKHIRTPVRIKLLPLSVADTRLLVDQLIQGTTGLANSVKTSITERAGGNPYFAEELVRIFMDHGGLVQGIKGWSVTNQAERLISEVPGTLQDLILARFDRLPEQLRQTLLKASVLGQSLSISLLKKIYQGDPDTLDLHLLELERREFLTHTKIGSEDGYIFKHHLLQEIIYNTLMKRELHTLHTKIAEAIETGEHWTPGERNEILAYHHTHSNSPSKAIPYLLASAERASQNFANETVVQLYRRLLSLMEESIEVTTVQIDTARIGLARALKFTGTNDEAIQILNNVVERNSDTEEPHLQTDPDHLSNLVESLRELSDLHARENSLDISVQLLHKGLDILGENGRQDYPMYWRRLADRLAWVYFRQGRLEEAYNLADLALLNVRSWEMEDPITVASLWNTIGGVYYTRSKFHEAIQSVESSLKIYKELNYHWGTAVSLNNLGVLNFAFGKWEEAVNYLEQADRMRSESGSDPERTINLKNLGEVLMAMGDYQRARVKMETGRRISERIGMNLAHTYAELGLCHLALKEQNISEAQIHLNYAKILIDAKDEESERACIHSNLQMLVEIERGNYPQALEAGQKAKKIAEKSGFPGELADVLRGLGRVYRLLSQFEQAETNLQESIQVAQSRYDRYSEAESLLELGMVYNDLLLANPIRQSYWLEQAEFCFEKAINAFENLGAMHELRRAREARSALSLGHPVDYRLAEENEVSIQVASLRAHLGIPDGEWYQASILSIYLTPNQDEDEELIFETIAFMIPTLIEMIQENDGQCVRSPEGVIAIFGAPAAHEDDPERAVETAMQLINFYSEIHQRTNLPITIRLGVSMGKIVAGRTTGNLEGEFLAAGEPLRLARLISEVSTPARVWVSQAVRNATAFRFEFSPIMVDFHHPIASHTLFQLEGLREQILPVRGLLGLKTAFVGRQNELYQMNQMVHNLYHGRGGLIWVDGDAGMGKSRLLLEFASQLPSDQFLVFRGSCTVRSSETAFSLFSGLLSNILDIQPNFTSLQINDQIEACLKLWPEELKEIQPFIQLLAGIQPSGPQAERVLGLEPEQLRRQTFVSIHRLISVLASQKPIVIILDDVQWIDSISGDLLLYLSHLSATYPVLFVCAQRRNEISTCEPTMARTRSMLKDQNRLITLGPLSIKECQTLINEFLSFTNLPEAIKALIIQQSGGNPYYIEEFVRMLIEQDYLRLVRGHLEVNQELKLNRLVIPLSLESLIRARVDSLGISARQLLQVASVIGQRFSQKLLVVVSEQENIDRYLEQLTMRGMLTFDVTASQWEFSHPMIEAIVYNTLLRAQRRILHHRTAKALEKLWNGYEGEHAEDLAFHYGKAEEYEKALYYLILAGERAAARHANDNAASFFEQASDLFGAVPAAGDELRYRICYGLGQVYQFVGKYDASKAILTTAMDLINSNQLTLAQIASLYRSLGDTLRKTSDYQQAIQAFMMALQILGEPLDIDSLEEAARIYVSLGWSFFMQANWDEAKTSVLTGIDYALNSGATNAIAMAENLLGGIYYRQGDLTQAIIHTRQAMKYWQEIGYSWGVAATMSNLGILEVSSGNWSTAYEAFLNSLNLRQTMGDVEGVAITQNNLGSLARDQGYLDQAEEYYRASLAVSQPFQMHWQTANSSMGLAQTLLYQDKLDEADRILIEGIRVASEINARDLLVEMQRTKAEIYVARELYTKAEQAAREAARLASEIGSSQLEASAWRVAAASVLHQDEPGEALLLLDHSWQALTNGSDELETGRTHVQAMIIAARLNQPQAVESHYQAAREIFEHLGARRDCELLQVENQSYIQI